MAVSRSVGRHVVHAPRREQDVAGRRLLEAGDHAQQRRLAAAGGAEQGHQLAGADFERHVLDGGNRAAIGLVKTLFKWAIVMLSVMRVVPSRCAGSSGRRRRR